MHYAPIEPVLVYHRKWRRRVLHAAAAGLSASDKSLAREVRRTGQPGLVRPLSDDQRAIIWRRFCGSPLLQNRANVAFWHRAASRMKLRVVNGELILTAILHKTFMLRAVSRGNEISAKYLRYWGCQT